MRTSLTKIPIWSVCLVGGIVAGVVAGFFTSNDGASTRFTVLAGVVGGLGFALVMTLVFMMLNQRTKEALGDAPMPVRRAADRALRRGRPVPADPEVRVAAIKLAEHRLAQHLRWRVGALIFWAFLLVLYTYLLFADFSLWRIAALLLPVFLIVQQFYLPKALRARIERLKAA